MTAAGRSAPAAQATIAGITGTVHLDRLDHHPESSEGGRHDDHGGRWPRARVRPRTQACSSITLSTLMYEIVLTRIFSVTMWYHFAFVAISVALFGMTVGALIVHLRPQSFTDDKVKRQMWRFSLAFARQRRGGVRASSSPIPFVPQLTMAGRRLGRAHLRGDLGAVRLQRRRRVPGAHAVPAPGEPPLRRRPHRRRPRLRRCSWSPSTGSTGRASSSSSARWPRCGSSAASPSTPAEHRQAGCRSAVLVVLVGGHGRSTSYRHEPGRPVHPHPVGQGGTQDTLHTLRPLERLLAHHRRRQPRRRRLAVRLRHEPRRCRDDRRAADVDAHRQHRRHDDHRLRRRPEATTDFLRYDITNLGYYALDEAGSTVRRHRRRAAGATCCRRSSSTPTLVTGVEINGNILDIVNDDLGDFTGTSRATRGSTSSTTRPAATWPAPTSEFDIIQISLIDTWAATSAGAFALSENSLYTTDAWDTFLDRLEPTTASCRCRGGTAPARPPSRSRRCAPRRWPPRSLTERGVENPRDHVLIYEGPPTAVRRRASPPSS